MKNNPPLEQVEREAAAWLIKRDSEQWSGDDDSALAQWLKASTGHRVTYIRLRSVWLETGRLRAVSPGFPLHHVPPRGAVAQSLFFGRSAHPESSVAPQRSRSAFKFYGLAASLLLAVAVGVGAYRLLPDDAPTYHTAIGGLAIVPMNDGSKVTLNTNSEIALGDSSHERRVYLLRGEAFFEVAKDPLRPFVVYANRQRVIAVGTKFAVRLKPESVQVAVTEGQVRLEKSAPLLTAGSIADADGKRISIRQRPLADVEQSLSWRAGYVVLRKTLLSDAVAEFNRYNHRQLLLGDPMLAEVVVGGNFESDNIDGFLRLLREGFQIRAEDQGNRIVLFPAVAP